MTSNANNAPELQPDTSGLSRSQLAWVAAIANQFRMEHEFWRDPASDLFTEQVLDVFGDVLRVHHAFSRQALSKDRFEFALEFALNQAGAAAQLVQSRTNPGHDITINGVPVSLKTQADANIREGSLHISKFMELGKGEWSLPLLRNSFLEHLRSYERIFQLRFFCDKANSHFYELVEIPKDLLLEGATAKLEVQRKSKQKPKPGYGYVFDTSGDLKFSLYFDGGTERKLQIKGIRKELCVVHATWKFSSSPIEQSLAC